VVRGANAPILSSTVIDELKKEHKVLNGEAERVEIHDPMFGHLEGDKSTQEDSDDSEKAEEGKQSCLLYKFFATKKCWRCLKIFFKYINYIFVKDLGFGSKN